MPSLQGRFRLQKGDFLLALDFQVPNKGVTAIFGHSGSGKTTLLRCVAGLERAPQGFFKLNAHYWQDESRGYFLPTYQRPLGYVFQEASLFSHLSVKGNLEYGFRRIPIEQRSKVRFSSAVELLGISTFLKRNPKHLSGGERQRVAIARALLTSPQLLLMDEPLAALDAESKSEILPYLERLHTELSIPVLYITHDISEVMRLADTLLVLARGKLIGQGALLDVLTRMDLPLNRMDEAGVIIEASVTKHDEVFHLTYLDFCGGQLTMQREDLSLGEKVRVRLKARDVSLALENETQSSILNIFKAEVLEILETQVGQLMIKLDIQGALLLARITKKSGVLLNLKIGMTIYARIKSVALL